MQLGGHIVVLFCVGQAPAAGNGTAVALGDRDKRSFFLAAYRPSNRNVHALGFEL